MRATFSGLIAAGLALVLLPSWARAQEPPANQASGFAMDYLPMDGPGGPALIFSAPVQDELGLSDKQKGQIKKIQASMTQKGRDAMEMARQEGLDVQEVMQGMAGLRRERDLSAARVLDKTQKARLAQLELQREGFLAVAKSDVAGKIKLTAPQSKKVKTILAEMNQARQKAMAALPAGAVTKGTAPGVQPGADLNGDGFFAGAGLTGTMPDVNSEEFKAFLAKGLEAEKAIRADAGKKIGEVLNKEQAEAFEKLLGKPFDLAKLNANPPPAAAPAEAATPKAAEEMPKSPPAKGKAKSRKDNRSS